MTSSGNSKLRKPKYFELQELSSGGMNNIWRVYRKKKGYYLWVSEEGEIYGPCKTVGDALYNDAGQYGGEFVEISTNIKLEELFEIMNMHNFEPMLHNLSRLKLNGIELDVESFKNFVAWYAKSQAATAREAI